MMCMALKKKWRKKKETFCTVLDHKLKKRTNKQDMNMIYLDYEVNTQKSTRHVGEDGKNAEEVKGKVND